MRDWGDRGEGILSRRDVHFLRPERDIGFMRIRVMNTLSACGTWSLVPMYGGGSALSDPKQISENI
jgi:hypothetical protein